MSSLLAEILRKRTLKRGKPPGTIVHTGVTAMTAAKCYIVHYSQESLQIEEDVPVESLSQFVADKTVRWVHVEGLHDHSYPLKLAETFKLHLLMLEDIMNTSQRTKLEKYPGQLFMVLRLLQANQSSSTILDEQFSLILGEGYLLSFSERPFQHLSNIFARLRNSESRLRKNGPDYLLYALLDNIVDDYFIVLQYLNDTLEDLEAELYQHSTPKTLLKIQNAKKDITHCHKVIWPLRDITNQLIRNDMELFSSTTKTYLQDLYDHTVQVLDSVESFRELSFGLVDLYMSTSTQRLNETIMFLTIVSTVFVPLTFIASLYGMNFAYMPLLDNPWGFFMVIAAMGSLALVMLLLFRYRRWI